MKKRNLHKKAPFVKIIITSLMEISDSDVENAQLNPQSEK